MATIPIGRGFWIWHLDKCEGGDLQKIAARARACGVTWLAIKAGNGGSQWSQFTTAVVQALHAAGIKVFGWSYDVPGFEAAQAKVIKAVAATGADGFLIDAEIDWEHVDDPDASARKYVAAIAALQLPADFVLGHAPFDVISGHQKFPYTVLGTACMLVSPQMYWSEHGISVLASTNRAMTQWAAYRQKHPDACKALLPSGYSVKPDLRGGSTPTAEEILQFEVLCAAGGCPGVLLWRWDGTPDRVWQGLEGTSYPGTCGDPDVAAPAC